MAKADVGLQSAELRAALEGALAGDTRRLFGLLARFGGLPSPRPNVALAAAFGEEVAAAEKAERLLTALGASDADADMAEAFLPVAAAHGWACRVRLGLEVDRAMAALFELAADERAAVRVGTLAALTLLAPRMAAGPDLLIARFLTWLEAEDREERWSALAVALDVTSERHFLEGLTDEGALIALTTGAIEAIATAPRATERLPSRRRVLASLPAALAGVISNTRDGAQWFEEVCHQARHPELRAVYAIAIERLRKRGKSEKTTTLVALQQALAGSAKPPRDPTRIKEGARGRGKKARRRGA